MSREVHVQFWERVGVKLPRATHLPLYRQELIYAQRHQVQLPRQTLARWVALAADWLRPIYEEIRAGVMGWGYVQVDELRLITWNRATARPSKGYLWTGSDPGGDVFFHWATSRATACLHDMVPATFSGTIQCDGYAAYRAFANGRGDSITLADCWAYARRKFYEAVETPRPITRSATVDTNPLLVQLRLIATAAPPHKCPVLERLHIFGLSHNCPAKFSVTATLTR